MENIYYDGATCAYSMAAKRQERRGLQRVISLMCQVRQNSRAVETETLDVACYVAYSTASLPGNLRAAN